MKSSEELRPLMAPFSSTVAGLVVLLKTAVLVKVVDCPAPTRSVIIERVVDVETWVSADVEGPDGGAVGAIGVDDTEVVETVVDRVLEDCESVAKVDNGVLLPELDTPPTRVRVGSARPEVVVVETGRVGSVSSLSRAKISVCAPGNMTVVRKRTRKA